MQRSIALSAFFLLASCGQAPVTGSGTGTPPTPTPTASGGPLEDGTYYTTFTPSPIRTTCSASLCAATPQTIPFSFRYVPSSNGYAFTNAGGTSIVPLKNGNTMEFTFTGTSYLNVNGCKVWTDPVMIITLSATTYTGIAEDFYHQEACNGYSAADCECANDVEG
jgi:hypothetical protein